MRDRFHRETAHSQASNLTITQKSTLGFILFQGDPITTGTFMTLLRQSFTEVTDKDTERMEVYNTFRPTHFTYNTDEL